LSFELVSSPEEQPLPWLRLRNRPSREKKPLLLLLLLILLLLLPLLWVVPVKVPEKALLAVW
jgi:hypothetical protein